MFNRTENLDEIKELFRIYGDNLKNMDPEQLNVLKLDFLECLKKQRRWVKMLTKKDILIITELRNNARSTLTGISKKTSIPISTIFDKIRGYQGSIIKKHTTIIDFSKLGFNARANIMMRVDRDAREEARKFLLNHQNINSVYKISNGYDFLVEGIFKNVKDVEDFMDYLGGKFKLEQTQVYYVIEDIKREAFMNDKELLDMVV